MQAIGELSPAAVLWITLIATAGVEAVSLGLRFGAGLRAQTDTSWLGAYTMGLRIHHGYIGVAFLLAALFQTPGGGTHNLLFMIGMPLAASDLVHHFLVLWPVTGHHEFFTRYHLPEPIPVLDEFERPDEAEALAFETE